MLFTPAAKQSPKSSEWPVTYPLTRKGFASVAIPPHNPTQRDLRSSRRVSFTDPRQRRDSLAMTEQDFLDSPGYSYYLKIISFLVCVKPPACRRQR